MTAFLWILVILSFIVAFVGLIKPVIPSVVFLWIGFLIYQFGINGGTLSWVFYVSMILLTIFMFFSDLIMNQFFVNKFGGSKLGERAAFIGVIIGCFVFPPFGILIVPFVLVFIAEMVQSNDVAQALKASTGSLFAFLSSTLAQAIIMFLMVVWFFIDALLLN
ncbi:DUF456 domain-containing protein [Staphylococcus massiliensis]|uniref:DUF456 domain-containing protein n=1 Tax=Staphylococcus massiliensis TaxID=555791 RepID=UPI001EDD6AD9|nr:DUF456 domain-containing protein [Staphylococcus massiliensis]MCG3400243.1 DUF456 domain-containing protein [Staphylococcus massiliensis]MCG3401873.1 DUF456 domain-containing protein [Staphylococcus massiliensis]MCG3413126.1 DUF456 domain-containing protein [Staphylococcus massiliensis]